MDNTLSTEATDWREGRRFRAFELNQEGCSQQRIAEALGVSKGVVSQWMKRARDGGGVEALKCRPAPGARPRLSEKQRMKLPELLARGELRLMAFEESYGRARGWLVSDQKGVWGKLSFCPIHRGGAVKDFLASGAASRLQLEQLPGYVADLNPDDGIWKHLKWVELKNLCSVRASLS